MSLPKVFVAMDFADQDLALDLARTLSPKYCGLKIGKELFTSCGPQLVDTFFHMGYPIFLDLKFHDIPNTVAKACQAAAKLGVSMLNVHTLGGEHMLKAAREAIEPFSNRPKLIGVTVLTSLETQDLKRMGLPTTHDKLVTHLSGLAADSALDGVVCSPKECHSLKEQHGKDFLLVTPGIRLKDDERTDDQKRVTTPQDAVHAGSDVLVIGRPITRAKDPKFVLQNL